MEGSVRMRVGRDFLHVNCRGQPLLTQRINARRPSEEYTFSLALTKVSEDTADGDVDLLTLVHVRADRCGRRYYLSAQRDFHTHPYRYYVTFRPSMRTDDCVWILTRNSGSRFVLESWLFRDYCLANDGGDLSLQRVSQARRSKNVVFYPVRHLTPGYRRFQFAKSRLSSSSSSSDSSESDLGSEVLRVDATMLRKEECVMETTTIGQIDPVVGYFVGF